MTPEQFIQDLQELMRLKGWDQPEAAKNLGVSKMTISQWTRGTIQPRGPAKLLVARMLKEAREEVLADLLAKKTKREETKPVGAH